MSEADKSSETEQSAPYIVLVEGKNPMKLIQAIFNPPQIKLVDFGSKDNLRTELKNMANEFMRTDAKVKRLGVIRDAEESSSSTRQSIRDAFLATGFLAPDEAMRLSAVNSKGISTAFLILPQGKDSGCLEHGCLDAYQDSANLACVDALINCVEKPKKEPKALDNWLAKAKVHALIAVSKKPEWTLGESGKANLWNRAHPSLGVIGDFLNLLRNGV